MELIFFFLISLAWSIIKGLFIILMTYYIYSFLMDAVENVWELIHPKSLKWVKDKFNRKKVSNENR